MIDFSLKNKLYEHFSLQFMQEEKLSIISPQSSPGAGIIIVPPLVVIITGNEAAFCVKN